MNCAILGSLTPTATASSSSSQIILRTRKEPISALAPLLAGIDSPSPFCSPPHPFPIRRLPRTAYLVRSHLPRVGGKSAISVAKEQSHAANVSNSVPDVPKSGIPAEDPTQPSSWVINLENSLNSFLISIVINLLETLYRDRPYARFYVLETIARVPYFAFTCVLHLYETCGWWRSPDYLKVHFAESWNELHHLLIMEELGGGKALLDRLIARNVAVVYYFLTVLMYIVSPRMAYNLSERVERHAYASYDGFLRDRGEELKGMPAPEVAVRYYVAGEGGDGRDLYMFDEFQTSRAPGTRRPKVENLYDVFVNIRDDEAEHVETMSACQRSPRGALRSPHSGKQESVGAGRGDQDSAPLSSSQDSRTESLAEDGGRRSGLSHPDRNN